MELHEALYTTRAMRRVRPDPIPLDVQARILDAAIHAPSGGNQQNWRFLLLDDPAKKAALAPLYQHAMGELWKSIYKDQLDAAHADPDAPESVQMLKVQRSAQWLADHFEDVPLYLFPFSQHDPTGSSIYPAVWSAMLAARAEGVGSCLTALLQFFSPGRDPRDPRSANRRGLDPLGHGELRLPDRHLGHRDTAPGARGRRTATHGAPASASRCPNPCGRADRADGAASPAPCCGWPCRPGDHVAPGHVLVVLESMKMEHVVEAATPGRIDSVAVGSGDAVQTGDVVVSMTESDELVDRRRRRAASAPRGRDTARARGAARPRAKPPGTPGGPRPPSAGTPLGRRTARENIEDLCDPGSFEEYGALVIAAQRARRSTDDLVANTPADGLIAGIGRVNGDLFDGERSRCAVLSYDYSVLGRHPGPDEPQEEGPALRARRTAAAAGRPLRRGRRRAARRHRHGRASRGSTPRPSPASAR